MVQPPPEALVIEFTLGDPLVVTGKLPAVPKANEVLVPLVNVGAWFATRVIAAELLKVANPGLPAVPVFVPPAPPPPWVPLPVPLVMPLIGKLVVPPL
jgi:hypothetical protein